MENTTKPSRKMYKSIGTVGVPIGIIIACFLLGILDMIFLRGAINKLFHFPMSMASFTAFALATVANFTAFSWGMATGQHGEERSINQYSKIAFFGWVAIGIAYMVIRVLNLMSGLDDGSIEPEFSSYIGEVVQMFVLLILYVLTGTEISTQARKIFDCNEAEYRKREKKFKTLHKRLSAKAADLQEDIGKLEGYERNYESLRLQYEKIRSSIRKAEKASMADVVGKTLKQHTEITPSEAHAVMNEILKGREG